MSSYSFRSSRPDTWSSPRPYSDASTRFMAHGPIQSMDQPTIWQRLFGAH
ncbi:hypothetical protein [Erythrobacter litoralis]|uniref:Uncharacterized protein n=1 Tax=Erythrobacter litoralis (strain HTCC2594) TaxID=314225 RepID=Q2N7M6_ERYLH|nr:hypothetical protein [Erythrobacter litoralis]ABC64315.1 hypothetical protein ELI_11115 [Erythrobacter litoralis HTCC2594]